jgi:hypothetical protein
LRKASGPEIHAAVAKSTEAATSLHADERPLLPKSPK